MSEAMRCQRCGGPLPKDGVLGGRCPRCMLELGLETSPDLAKETLGVDKVPVVTVPPLSVGRYRILKVIGEGGMGVVYEAEQDQPRRTVALKIIKPGLVSDELIRRFEQESQALGRLQHPGIAQIYEAGTLDTGFGPQPYFAMELIRGHSPREYAESHRLDTSQRVEIMVKICNAVHHAHQRGLIHRDLKPGNILVDETGQPKILDFGVARVTDSDTRATQQTDMGQLIGTLAYMSPEQALADPLDIDTRSDVYSLGVILYELLTGRLPYTVSKNLHDAIHAIREEDPARLSAMNRTYRGDIETIVGKALEKDRTRRYASAAGMAADLQRYLKDEPIAARPPSTSYQLQKFARRHKALVSGVSAVFVVLVAWGVTSTRQAIFARGVAAALRIEQQNLLVERNRANSSEQAANAAAVQARQDRDKAFTEQQRADTEAARAKELRLISISQLLANDSIRESAGRLDDDRAALLARQAMLFNARISGQSKYLVEEALQQAARLDPPNHDLIPGYKSVFNAAAFSVDGVLLAAGGDDHILRVWDMRKPGEPPLLLQTTGGRGILSVAFSRDGQRLAAGLDIANGIGAVLLWDLTNLNAPPMPIPGSSGRSYVAFSPDSSRLAAGGSDPKGVRVWDLRNLNAPPMTFEPQYPAYVNCIAFSPDGARLAASSGDTLQVWDSDNPAATHLTFHLPPDPGKPAAAADSLAANPIQIQSHAFGVVMFSPDGVHVAAGAPDAIAEWDLQRPMSPPALLRIFAILFSHVNIAYSPDGNRLAYSQGNSISIWNPRSLNPASVPFQAFNIVNSLAYSPNGSRLVAATSSGVRIWDMSGNPQPIVSQAPQNSDFAREPGQKVAYSGDFTRLAVANGSRLRVWDLRNPAAQPVTLKGPEGLVLKMAFSSDNARLAAASADRGNNLWMWDLRSPGGQPWLLGQFVSAAFTFSPNSLRLAAGQVSSSGYIVRTWDLRNPGALTQFQGTETGVPTSLAFSPDNLRLAVSVSKTVEVWELSRPGSSRMKFPVPNTLQFLTFSADGSRLAGLDREHASIGVWDLRNPGVPVAQFPSQLGTVLSLALSPEGGRLAAGMGPGIQLFDLRNPGAPALLLQSPAATQNVEAVSFSSDGLRLSSGGLNGRTAVWRLWSAAADYLCTRVSRNLSNNEWLQFVGEGIPYERTCPALPPGAGAPGAPK